ncbi:MAG: winged helix DNA-binding protein [Novosphingobium sp.]|nr:winged helix DNA-binding protein [Novosphingobium sp.]
MNVARDLDQLAVPSATFGAGRAARAGVNASQNEPYWLVLARRAYADRSRRNHLFDADLFGEPAWDLLLDLFVATHEGRPVSVTSACIAANVPTTTALRWISALEAKGLIERANDPRDARRALLRLTGTAYDRMLSYFSLDERSAIPLASNAA